MIELYFDLVRRVSSAECTRSLQVHLLNSNKFPSVCQALPLPAFCILRTFTNSSACVLEAQTKDPLQGIPLPGSNYVRLLDDLIAN